MMNETLSRRNFSKALLVSGMSAFTAGAGPLFAASQPNPASLLVSKEKHTIAGLTQLFPRVLIQAIGEGRQRVIQAAVSIDDMGSFLDTERRNSALPNTQIQAKGDTLRFSHQNTNYELRMLLPADFAQQSGQAFHA